jgi:uncharacterized SAM-binding protein YcdF (DUF218 family)
MRRRLIAFSACVMLLCGLYVCRVPVLRSMADFLDVSEPPARCDYVLPLGGSPDTRPFAAAAFYRAGLARKVILTRPDDAGYQLATGEQFLPNEQDLAHRALEARGVPAGAIVSLPAEMRSTFDEADALFQFLAGDPDATVTVITSSFHTRRTRWIFRKVFGDQAWRLRFTGITGDGYDSSDWWRDERGCVLVINEYLKLAFYAVRY